MRTEIMGPRENRRYFSNVFLVFELCITSSNGKYKVITANVKCFVIGQVLLNNLRNTHLEAVFHHPGIVGKVSQRQIFEGPGVFSNLGFEGEQWGGHPRLLIQAHSRRGYLPG